jgi:proteasome lid subunit RPN8/RPN11
MKNKLRKQTRTTFLQLTTATPVLRFSPTAWAKLLFLRDYGETEVGGFGIAASDDLLFVEEVQLVKQDCSWAHVAFDDESVADFFDVQVDQGRQPEQFARIWVHTHPGDCPQPSLTDEETFERVFGRSDWALMFIVAREGQSYARLRFNVGPGGAIEIPVKVDYSRPFSSSNLDEWEKEYLANVGVQQSKCANPGRVGLPRPLTVEEQAESDDPFFVEDEYALVFGDADKRSDGMSIADYDDAIERWARDRYPDLHDSEIAAFVAEWSIDQERYRDLDAPEIAELVTDEADSESDAPDAPGWQ